MFRIERGIISILITVTIECILLTLMVAIRALRSPTIVHGTPSIYASHTLCVFIYAYLTLHDSVDVSPVS